MNCTVILLLFILGLNIHVLDESKKNSKNVNEKFKIQNE